MRTRRLILTGIALSGAMTQALAHHGWSSFDESKPVYIEGVVKSVKWQNPHPELVVEVAEKLTLPNDLTQRPFPKQVSSRVTPGVVSQAQVPNSSRGAWRVELAPLPRMAAWGLNVPPKPGDKVSMIGYALPTGGEKLLRVEILYMADGKAYGLRSAPAQ